MAHNRGSQYVQQVPTRNPGELDFEEHMMLKHDHTQMSVPVLMASAGRMQTNTLWISGYF